MQVHWYKSLLLKDASLLQSLSASGTDGGGTDAPQASGRYKQLNNLIVQVRDS